MADRRPRARPVLANRHYRRWGLSPRPENVDRRNVPATFRAYPDDAGSNKRLNRRLPRKAGEGDRAPQRAWWRGRDWALSLRPPLPPSALPPAFAGVGRRSPFPVNGEGGRQGI